MTDTRDSFEYAGDLHISKSDYGQIVDFRFNRLSVLGAGVYRLFTAMPPVIDFNADDVDELKDYRELHAAIVGNQPIWPNGWCQNVAAVAFVINNERQAALQAGAGDGVLAKIGELIRTQDNRITDQPIFIVQQKRIIAGMDTDYAEKVQWIDNDSQEVDDDLAAELEAEYEETYSEREGYRRIGYVEIWEFVQACFTEQGCKDYIARDGHNLREPRIYASGSYRNHEWQAVRKYLIDNAQATEGE